MKIDLYFFNLINGFAGRWTWLDYFGIFCAEYLGYVLLFVLALFLLANWKKSWKTVFFALAAGVVSRFIIGFLIRFLWFRPRPFVVENFIPLIYQNPAEASFPSGHALFYFAISAIIYLCNKKAGILFYIASFFIVISRVFAGVHWPSDILAGAILGILTGYILNWLFRAHAHKIIKGYND